MIAAWLLPLIGYLAGSLASAVVVCRMMGLPDPRSGGSGNPGATNVLRLGGKKAALLTLVGDVLKGVLPVLLAHTLALPAWSVALTALAAFLGHLFPVFFGFRGGKGVATAGGAIVALSWQVGALLVATWLLVAAITRYSSVSSLSAAAAAPVAALLLGNPPAHVLPLVAMSVLVFWRHAENIHRLRAGTESRIGRTKPDPGR
jgi:glycerol-3-phosphate acyltransferase PlsY